MQWSVKPRVGITIFGDWSTIISVREYRDAMIDQKPDDLDSAEYNQYRLYFDTAKEIFAAYQAFSAKGLQCEFVAACDTPDRSMSVFIATAGGYGHNAPLAQVIVADARINDAMATKIKQATKILLGD